MTTTSGAVSRVDLDGRLTVARLAHDLHVGGAGEQHPEPGPHEVLVVTQHHPYGHRIIPSS